MQKPDTIFLIAIVSMVVLAIGSTFWLFYLQKNYTVIVEASCDPASETCFYRLCTSSENTGDCPPNELENYKVFSLQAYDFENCADNSCKQECESGTFECVETVCGETEGDECSMPDIPSSEESQ